MARQLTSNKRIELREEQPKDCSANLIDVQALAAANEQWKRVLRLAAEPIQLTDIGSGLVRLRATGVTGVIRVGTTDIEIAPKFLNSASGSWQTVLWRILGAVEGGQIDERVTSAHELATEGLPELMAEMFLSSYARGGARGLPRCYVTHASSGQMLRGALDTTRIGHWIAKPWEVPYITDTLTDNTSLGRLLRWAADVLASTVRSPGRARELRLVVSSLSHVSDQPPHLLDAQRILLGTQHQALEPARLIGLLLLEGGGVHHDRGGQELSGFLWDSANIYENFVFWLCRRAAGKVGLRIHKLPNKFGVVISGMGDPLVTTPDVVFTDAGGGTAAVMDAKYKNFGKRPKAPDTYQVLTAAHVLGCQRVSLTYPAEYDGMRTVWRVESSLGASEVEMSAIPLNLMALGHEGGFKALVETIVDWLTANPVT
jgi:5-methylcytosine-specific restriction endonuclease McrBC regulatory subunit McrC